MILIGHEIVKFMRCFYKSCSKFRDKFKSNNENDT